MYRETVKIKVNDCDDQLRVQPEYFFARFDEVATTDAELSGFYEENFRTRYGWIVSKQTLKMNRPVYLNEELTFTTYSCKATAAIFPRYYEITHGDEIVATCASNWTLMDLNRRRVVRLKSLGLNINDTEPIAYMPQTLDDEEMAFWGTYQPQYSDIDTNGHFNNGRYVRLACNMTGIDYLHNHVLTELSINYKREVLAHETLALYQKQDDKQVKIKGMIDDQICFIIEMHFLKEKTGD